MLLERRRVLLTLSLAMLAACTGETRQGTHEGLCPVSLQEFAPNELDFPDLATEGFSVSGTLAPDEGHPALAELLADQEFTYSFVQWTSPTWTLPVEDPGYDALNCGVLDTRYRRTAEVDFLLDEQSTSTSMIVLISSSLDTATLGHGLDFTPSAVGFPGTLEDALEEDIEDEEGEAYDVSELSLSMGALSPGTETFSLDHLMENQTGRSRRSVRGEVNVANYSGPQ